MIRRVADSREHRCGLIVERAGRLLLKADALEASEHTFFAAAARIADTCDPYLVPEHRPIPVFNPVIWVVETERELTVVLPPTVTAELLTRVPARY